MVQLDSLVQSLPNPNTTKLLLLQMKLKTITVEFYSGSYFLVDTSNAVLAPTNSKLESKILYFENLDYKRRTSGNHLKVFDLDHLFFDILLGHDVSLAFPISAIVVHAKIGKLLVNFENHLFFRLVGVMETTSDIFSFGNVSKIR